MIDDYVKRTYEKALEEGDLTACMQIAKHSSKDFNIDMAKLEDSVIKSENPFYAYNYVKDFKCKNKKPFEKIILDSKNGHIASSYAVQNKNDCDIKALEDIVLKYGDSFDSAYFVTNIEQADVEKHKELILNEEEAYACYLYCKKFQPVGEDLKRFQDIILDSEDAEFCLLFATEVYCADVIKLAEVVLENGGTYDMIKLAMLIQQKIYDEIQNAKQECGLSNFVDGILNSPLTKYAKIRDRIESFMLEYATDDDLVEYYMLVDDVDPYEVQKRIEATNRTDLKIRLSEKSDIELNSLVKSINKDRNKLKFKVTYKDEKEM